MKKILLPLLLLTACQTDPNQVPAQLVPTAPMPAKAVKADVKQVVQPFVTSWIRRSLAANPTNKQAVALYMRQVGNVFCSMSATSNFDPNYLTTETDKLKMPRLNGSHLADVRVVLTALYRGSFESSSPTNSKEFCDLFCDAIAQALASSGV